MKENHGQLYDLVGEWLSINGVEERPPDDVQSDKGHGRVERRELWVVPAGEMGLYLHQDFDWPHPLWMGQIRRYRRRLHQDDWDSVETTFWIAGGQNLPELSTSDIQSLLRQHWCIENSVFHVRDVTCDEDRLHGRKIAFSLSALRNQAINLIRRAGFRFIPDARRFLPSQPDFGLAWLFQSHPLEHR